MRWRERALRTYQTSTCCNASAPTQMFNIASSACAQMLSTSYQFATVTVQASSVMECKVPLGPSFCRGPSSLFVGLAASPPALKPALMFIFLASLCAHCAGPAHFLECPTFLQLLLMMSMCNSNKAGGGRNSALFPDSIQYPIPGTLRKIEAFKTLF